MPLCNICKDFDIQSFLRDSDGFRGYSLNDVRQGFDNDCEFCTLIWDAFEALPSKYRTRLSESPYAYAHFSLSENGEDGRVPGKFARENGLRANRLTIRFGFEFQEEREQHGFEYCLVAELG
jgi:hypothetical protein